MGIWPVMIGHDKTTTIAQIYNTTVGSASIGAFGRNGTQGIRLTAGSGGAGATASVFKTLPASVSEIYQAFSYKTNVLPDATFLRVIAEWRDAGNVQMRLVLASDGTLRLYRSSTFLVTVPDFSMLTNTIYHIEWYGLIHATNGGYGVWVNEAEKILETSGQITQGAASSIISQVRIATAHGEVGPNNGSSAQGDFDDHIVDIERIFDLNLREDLPISTGGVDEWSETGPGTTTLEAVDEAPPDEDTSYAHTATVGHRSRWVFPSIPGSAVVRALGSSIRAKKTDPGTALIKGLWYDGLDASEHQFDEKAPSQGSYEYHDSAFKDNPATAAAFTAAEINAGELGIERTG